MLKGEFGWLKRADGSCLLAESNADPDASAVLVAVHGPGPAKGKTELVDKACVQVSMSPLNYPPGGDSDIWAGKLEQILQGSIIAVDEYPRSLIQVAIQPLNIGPRFLTVMVDALFLALLDASVPLKRPFVAISAASEHDLRIFDPLNGTLILQESELGIYPAQEEAVAEKYEKLKNLYNDNCENGCIADRNIGSNKQ